MFVFKDDEIVVIGEDDRVNEKDEKRVNNIFVGEIRLELGPETSPK